MIQPQCLRRAATALPPSISTRRLSSKTQAPDTPWPLLKKRTRPSSDDDHIHSGGTALIESFKKRRNPIQAEITPSGTHDAASSADSCRMLILHGLSTNLNASDFYRLAPSDLSSWQSVIKKVQQQRNPTTLEPLGRYHISFSSSTAAMSYRDRLVRLNKLARYKLTCENGLWESSIPRHLRSPLGDDPAAELEKLTVTSGTYPAVNVLRRRVSGANKWAQKLVEIAKKFDYGVKPPVVLVHVHPPTMTAEDLGRYIHEDGVSRACEWKVCPPQELQATMADKAVGKNDDGDGTAAEVDVRPQTQREIDIREKTKSRFVIVCANEAEARRFHRHWNQRTLTAGPGDTGAMRNIVHASIINW